MKSDLNKLHHRQDTGISVSTDQGVGNYNFYVYGNYIVSCGRPAWQKWAWADPILIKYNNYDNVISVSDSRGIAVMGQPGSDERRCLCL